MYINLYYKILRDTFSRSFMPRLHQDTRRPETCIPDEQLVSGYIFVTDTCRRIHVAIRFSDILLLFIYVTVDLYPFVSSNRRATNWRQFCHRYKKHVDGNKWIQLVSGNMCPGVNAALDARDLCTARRQHCQRPRKNRIVFRHSRYNSPFC